MGGSRVGGRNALLEGVGRQAPETAESQHSAPGTGSDHPHLVSVLYWRSVELIPFCSFVASATCNESSLQLSSEVTKIEGKPNPQQKDFPVSSCSGRGLYITCQGAWAQVQDFKWLNGFQAMPCLYSCFGAVVKDEHVTVTGTSCLEKCDTCSFLCMPVSWIRCFNFSKHKDSLWPPESSPSIAHLINIASTRAQSCSLMLQIF